DDGDTRRPAARDPARLSVPFGYAHEGDITRPWAVVFASRRNTFRRATAERRMAISIVLAGIAIVGSLVAAWVSLHAPREVIRAETVTATYSGFRLVNELRSTAWQVAHVLDVPENYELTVSRLRVALADTPPAGVAELLVRERAVAIALIQIFEESVYQ